jgi:hypothetical protein
MSTIAKRVDKVEAAMKARAGDLSVLSDEELEARLATIVGKMLSNKSETIQVLSAMAPDDMNRLAALVARLADARYTGDIRMASKVGDAFLFEEVRAMLAAANAMQANVVTA